MLLMIHLLGGSFMTAAIVKKADYKSDRWLENQIVELTKNLLHRPENFRGPYVITNSMLTKTKVKNTGQSKSRSAK